MVQPLQQVSLPTVAIDEPVYDDEFTVATGSEKSTRDVEGHVLVAPVEKEAIEEVLRGVEKQEPVEKKKLSKAPSGDAGHRTKEAMASLGKTPETSRERMAEAVRIQSSREGRRGHPHGHRSRGNRSRGGSYQFSS